MNDKNDFRNQIRIAILGWLKERGHLNVTQGTKINQFKSLPCICIKLRSLQGPPFMLFGTIIIGESEVECQMESFNDLGHRGIKLTPYRIDLADPQLFDVIEKFVNEIKN